MSFIDLQEKARAEWKRLRNERICIFIDTGTGAVLEQVVADVARLKIDAKIMQTGSLGWREMEPVVSIARPGKPRIYYANMTPALGGELLAKIAAGEEPGAELALGTDAAEGFEGIPALGSLPFFQAQHRVAMRNCGEICAEEITQYIAHGGYAGLSKALGMTAEALLDEMEATGLARTWRACGETESEERFVIGCEAGGTDKDAVLLEGDPHAVLEGLLIAAYAAGAKRAIVCVSPEHAMARRRIAIALGEMRGAGLLGENILGSEFSCEIEIREVAAGLADGEETILINLLEGRQPRARVRPPEPETAGLNGRPTVVENVETLAVVSAVAQKGAEGNRGTKMVALAGKLQRTGVVEVAIGTPLRVIAEEIGGGSTTGLELKAVQIGGPAGGWIPAGGLDIALDCAALAKAGCVLGSGALLAVDTSACAVDMARQAAAYAHGVSCGKCSFGREGTRQLMDVTADIAKGRSAAGDTDLLLKLGDAMKAGSLCANGKNAPDAVLTALEHFRAEFEAHVSGKQCAAKVCDGN